MTSPAQDPGYATLEELTLYWRMPSQRAARELARALGLRRVRRNYPWFAIWQVEGLAPPARKRWEELKYPHLTTTDLAEMLGESDRSARRRDSAKPDASFTPAAILLFLLNLRRAGERAGRAAERLDPLKNSPSVSSSSRRFAAAANVSTAASQRSDTKMAYEFCRTRLARRIWAIKGRGGPGIPVWPRRPTRTNKGKIPLFIVGVDAVKDAIYARLRLTEPGPGAIHFPRRLDADYFRQLTAERVVTRFERGRPIRSWQPT